MLMDVLRVCHGADRDGARPEAKAMSARAEQGMTLTGLEVQGHVFRVTCSLHEGRTAYRLEPGPQAAKLFGAPLSYEALCALRRRMLADIWAWQGILCDRYDGTCGCDLIRAFESQARETGGQEAGKEQGADGVFL